MNMRTWVIGRGTGLAVVGLTSAYLFARRGRAATWPKVGLSPPDMIRPRRAIEVLGGSPTGRPCSTVIVAVVRTCFRAAFRAGFHSSKGKIMTRNRIVPVVLTLFVAFVFVQSLFFKFTDSPETQHIFGTLDVWGAELGFPGLFAPSGIFSQYVVGSAELVASVLLLAGLLPALRFLRPIGALVGLGVISGAIFFHLFTPLGIAVPNSDGSSDGGLLFAMACGVWVSCLILLVTSRGELLQRLGARAPAATPRKV